MMNKLKRWIAREYLPAFARTALEEEIMCLRAQNQRQAVEILQKKAYISGLLEGQKAARRIVIQNKT